jgi:hypothetical protein
MWISFFSRYSVCSCTSPVLWNARTVLLPNGTVILAPICTVFEPCYLAALNKFMNDLSIIDQQCSHCTSECQLTSFGVQLSSILVSFIFNWFDISSSLKLQAPAIATQVAINQWLEKNALINSSRTISLPADWSSNSSTYIKQNYVGLQVVLGTFLVNSYTQSATLSWTDVLSNVGGQTGL